MGKVKIEDLKMFFKAKVDTYLKFAKEYSKKGEYGSDIFSLSELLDDFTLGSDYSETMKQSLSPDSVTDEEWAKLLEDFRNYIINGDESVLYDE